MVTQLLSDSHKHTHTKPLWVNFVFGPISAHGARTIALKSEFFDFFQTICFWKAATELEINLLEFLGSEVI